MSRLQARLDRNRQAEEGLWARIRTAGTEAQVYQREVTRLKAEYQNQGRRERPRWVD